MTWTLDTAHTDLGFSVRHMMISKVRGSFSKFEGTVELNADDLTQSSVAATIDVASIQTGDEKRDGHLKSADFFDVEKHPTIDFRSTKVTKTSDGKLTLVGDLTIAGKTNSVSFAVEVQGPAQDPWGNQRLGFSLTGEIAREDFGLGWNQALEAGGVLVGKTVAIAAEVQAMRATPR